MKMSITSQPLSVEHCVTLNYDIPREWIEKAQTFPALDTLSLLRGEKNPQLDEQSDWTGFLSYFAKAQALYWKRFNIAVQQLMVEDCLPELVGQVEPVLAANANTLLKSKEQLLLELDHMKRYQQGEANMRVGVGLVFEKGVTVSHAVGFEVLRYFALFHPIKVCFDDKTQFAITATDCELCLRLEHERDLIYTHMKLQRHDGQPYSPQLPKLLNTFKQHAGGSAYRVIEQQYASMKAQPQLLTVLQTMGKRIFSSKWNPLISPWVATTQSTVSQPVVMGYLLQTLRLHFRLSRDQVNRVVVQLNQGREPKNLTSREKITLLCVWLKLCFHKSWEQASTLVKHYNLFAPLVRGVKQCVFFAERGVEWKLSHEDVRIEKGSGDLRIALTWHSDTPILFTHIIFVELCRLLVFRLQSEDTNKQGRPSVPVDALTINFRTLLESRQELSRPLSVKCRVHWSRCLSSGQVNNINDRSQRPQVLPWPSERVTRQRSSSPKYSPTWLKKGERLVFDDSETPFQQKQSQQSGSGSSEQRQSDSAFRQRLFEELVKSSVEGGKELEKAAQEKIDSEYDSMRRRDIRWEIIPGLTKS